ncbi:unnamed protein product, partial [Polarella glacialis]
SHDCGSDCHAHGSEEHGHGHGQEADSGSEGETQTCPCAGGLILRGNRCVLIRSLAGEWEGMRIPWLAVEPGEHVEVASARAASELCSIEPEEMHLLRNVLPVAIAVPGMPEIALYAFYAVNPPPPGALEAADTEDPEDIYDWYTFPSAMRALAGDAYARAALATMAFALAAGAAAGTVPNQWGGVFGQEWTEAAFKLLPGPKLELDPGNRTIASLMDAGAAAASSSSGSRAQTTATEEANSTKGNQKRKRVKH